jgi:hypothetical protein
MAGWIFCESDLESVKKSAVLASHVRHRVEDSGALGCTHLPLQRPQSRRHDPDCDALQSGLHSLLPQYD